MMKYDAEYWIKTLGLTEHPEGGYFRETYRASENISRIGLPDRYQGDRSTATGIYFLLKHDGPSMFHRLASDETWHFYDGNTLTIHVIDEAGRYDRIKLGVEPENHVFFQAVIPHGVWFAATVDSPGGYALVGCSVSPGFDFDDFELGNRREMISKYPQHRKVIEQLTFDHS